MINEPAFEGAYNKDILQSLRTIFCIPEGSVWLDRDFGTSPETIDAPLAAAMNIYAVDAVQKVNRYEPRVIVRDVTFETDGNGQLTPTIHVVENADYDGDVETVEDDGEIYDFWEAT
jgi:hypothetical protein